MPKTVEQYLQEQVGLFLYSRRNLFKFSKEQPTTFQKDKEQLFCIIVPLDDLVL